MAIRSKVSRSSSKRSPVAVARHTSRPVRPGRHIKTRELKPIKREVRRTEHLLDRKTVPFAETKAPAAGPGHAFNKAMRYLDTLTDFERLRIVRYNHQN